jgi:hypothetical protein
MDFDFASKYVVNLLKNAWQMVNNYESQDRKSEGKQLSYTYDQKLAMTFRIYNHGSVTPGMRKKLRTTDDPKVLDPGTARNNYVSNLVNLTTYCFRDAVTVRRIP